MALANALPRPVGYTPRRGRGLTGYERVLVRAGLGPVAGIDEAGRGACAGPLVVAAVALGGWHGDTGEIADSKTLTAAARESAYQRIVRSAQAWHVVVIEPAEIDRFGLHVCNVAGMRRALAGLAASPGYVLTDGFEVPGLAVPALAMWKGDQVAACVAAASIVAKVTRDKIMSALHAEHPQYGFARHKGYSTPSHMAALDAWGPSPVHRRSFVNVSSRLIEAGYAACLPGPADEALPDCGVILADGSVAGDGAVAGAAGVAGGTDDATEVDDGERAERRAGLDLGRDGPTLVLISRSPATIPASSRANGRGAGQAEGTSPAARAPASSKGRT